MERCNIVKGYGSRAAALRAGQEEEAAASEILSADIQCDITHSRYGLSSLGPRCTRVYDATREIERVDICARTRLGLCVQFIKLPRLRSI